MNPWTHIVGWTLMHFVWQGTVLALAAAAALRLSRHRSADVRYAIATATLVVMVAAPATTAHVLMTPAAVPAPAVDVLRQHPAEDVAPSPMASWTSGPVTSMRRAWAHVDAVLPGVVFVWCVGVALLTVRMAGGLWHVRRLRRSSLASDSSRWQAPAERIARRLGLRGAIRVVDSPRIDTPAVVGWLQPVVLLPIAALANLSPSQVEAILAHELIHVRRHDFAVNVLQTVAETLLFFHPGVWWISARIRAEREHCCDDATVQVCGDPVDYAAALAELEAWRSHGTTLALAATDGPLTLRVRRVLGMPIGHQPSSLSWVVTVGLACLLAVAAGSTYLSSFAPAREAAGSMAGPGQSAEPITAPDTFDWQVQRTAHFEIHYYPALVPNLEQVADAAERAYRRISGELQHDLSFKVPLILFKTRSEFSQQLVAPAANDAIGQGLVTSFAEPQRNRIVFLVEEDPGRLYRQIAHELSHVFAFDVIPRERGDDRRVPAWIDEGFAEYMTGTWTAPALARMRDVVSTDRIPRMTALTGRVDMESLGGVADLGHAAFEFIESEYGKAAVWQFLLEVRRDVLDGTDNVYQAAFNRTPEEFDAAWTQYLRRRFGDVTRR